MKPWQPAAHRYRTVLAVLAVTFPFFALVLCGYLAVRREMLPQSAIPGLNGFVLFFALPCLLFRFGASTPITRLVDWSVFTVYLVCAAVMVTVTIALSLSRRIDWNNASLGALTAAFPNSGFMGVPLLVSLLGERAAGPVIVTIVVDLFFTGSLCIALSRLDAATGLAGVRAAAGRALRSVVANPMPWAILLGGTCSALQIRLYEPLFKTIGLLADAASPVALFAIGAVLARSQMATADSTPLVEYVPVALKKLFLHPLLVLIVGGLAIHAGLPLERFALQVTVLVAALPSASTVSVLAERLDADSGRIARVILVSTALSFLSFSGFVALII